MCVCVRERERESVCVCVCVCERERERERERELANKKNKTKPLSYKLNKYNIDGRKNTERVGSSLCVCLNHLPLSPFPNKKKRKKEIEEEKKILPSSCFLHLFL